MDEKQNWGVIKSFYKTKGLVQHQIKSFNDFIYHSSQRIIDSEPEIRIKKESKNKEYIIRFGEIFIDSPNIIDEDRNVKYILPREARIKNLNYSSSLCLNITEINIEDGVVEEKNHTRLPIAKIPIMIGCDKCPLSKMRLEERVEAGECENDSGGYFIIKGNERVIIAQKRVNYNQVYVFEQSESKKNKSKYRYISETRSMSSETGHSVLIKSMFGYDDRSIHFSIPHISQPVPVGIVFKALGYTDNEDIKKFINLPINISIRVEKYLKYIYRDSYYITINKQTKEIKTQEDALKYLGNYAIHTIPSDRRVAYATRALDTELLPHLGVNATAVEKGIFLGYILNRLILVSLGIRAVDERDNISNKRYESTGILFNELFRSLFKRWIENIREQVTTKRQDIISVISKNNHITSNIIKCMATGNWGVQGNNYIRTGVSQILNRLTYSSFISHLHRVVIPISKEGKNVKIRQVHPSQILFECPVDTPEGSSAGIVTNLAFMTNITNKIPTTLVRSIIEQSDNLIPIFKNENLKPHTSFNLENLYIFTKVFLNGIPLGFCEDPYDFVEELRDWRSNGVLSYQISIIYDREDEEVRIFCDEGRLIRPIYKVQDKKLLISRTKETDWDKLVEEGYIQYLDTNEAEYSEIVFSESEILSTTEYCEIHPTMMLGICANLIPFPNHTQGPRNTYQCIYEEEPVLMRNGSWKKIKDIKIGESIVTFDPETLEKETTVVTKVYNNSTTKKIIQLTTKSGRSIVLTVDHKIMTSRGWVKAGKINKDDRVAICSNLIAKIIYSEIGDISPMENVRISDLTTASNFHSFVAGQGFCVHNCSMAKQALGMYALNHQTRTDTFSFVMDYPQKPIVNTKIGEIIGYNDMPCGINAIVAIISNPFSQEDSVVLNKSSLERGMFVTTSYRTVVSEEKKRTNYSQEIIGLPIEKIRKEYNYSLLDENGIVRKGAPVNRNDVVIGKYVSKIIKKDKNSEKEYVDISVIIKSNEEGIVDRVITTTNSDGYKLIKIVIRRTRVPEVGDKLACSKPNTEVLTDKGWKKIKNITTEDKVAILDNDNVKYECPLEIHEYDYDGKMYELKSQQVDLTVTPNHRLWVKRRDQSYFEFMEAKKAFGKRIRHKKNANLFEPENPIGELFIVPKHINGNGKIVSEKIVLMNDWLVFFGIWLAEGWASKYKIFIAPHKARVRTALETAIKNMGYHICKSTNVWRIYNVQLAAYMRPFSVGAINKFMPEWVWRLNKNQCRTLLSSMELGDGHLTKSNSRVYYTSSKQLADDVTRLALHAGYSTNCRVPEGRKKGTSYNFTEKGENQKGSTNADNHVITILKTKVEPQINHCKTQNGQSENWVDYRGKVYCLTVRTGIFYIREGGKPVWSGNSRAAQKGTVGMIISQEDMPFTSEGITPDIILNPHALPSRMTVSQLLECLLSKNCSLEGKRGDCTAFEHNGELLTKDIGKKLNQFGYDKHGWETMYSGVTGEMLRAKIFIGPTYYQRLKHLVSEKMHCLTMDHEVLTIQGWKEIGNISYTDKIAILVNNNLVYEPPNDIMLFNYTGRMHNIEGRDIDLCVTDSHKMWVSERKIQKSENENRIIWDKYKLIKAKNLICKTVKYKNDANWKAKQYHFSFPGTDRIINTEKWLIFFAYWVENGWLDTEKMEILFDFRNINYECRILTVLESLEFCVKHSYRDNNVQNNIIYSISDVKLYNYLYNCVQHSFDIIDTFIQCKTMRLNYILPDWVFNLSKHQARILINSIVMYNKQNSSRIPVPLNYISENKRLVDQLQQLCLHAGWISNISKGVGKYKISIYTGQKSINSNKCKKFSSSRNCIVFCLTVSSGVFYTRRNGKAVWTGNSRGRGNNNVISLTRQPVLNILATCKISLKTYLLI
jgi:DNA-directed RNA polymerase beta subunit